MLFKKQETLLLGFVDKEYCMPYTQSNRSETLLWCDFSIWSGATRLKTLKNTTSEEKGFNLKHPKATHEIQKPSVWRMVTQNLYLEKQAHTAKQAYTDVLRNT